MGSPLQLSAALIAFLWAATSGPARAAETAEATRALVERAVAHIREVGPERGFFDISSPDGGFIDGELYVFCFTGDGISLANGGNPKLVGKTLASVRDAEGKQPIAEANRVIKAGGRGWVDFLWPNPLTGRVQRKNVFVLAVDTGTVCGSGYYQP